MDLLDAQPWSAWMGRVTPVLWPESGREEERLLDFSSPPRQTHIFLHLGPSLLGGAPHTQDSASPSS